MVAEDQPWVTRWQHQLIAPFIAPPKPALDLEQLCGGGVHSSSGPSTREQEKQKVD